MLVIRNHVDGCTTNAQGDLISSLIDAQFKQGQQVILSFENSGPVSSSFVNSAFVDLAKTWKIDYITKNLKIIHSTRAVNEMIRRQVYNHAK